MAAGAGKHEKVPDEMGVTHPFVDEKQNASGVGNAAGEQSEQRAGRQV